MSQSPIEQLLAAIDTLDADAVMGLLAPQPRVLIADGRRAEGRDEVSELIAALLAELRAASHRIAAQWQVDDVWIAEVEASYELRDWLQLNALPRAFVVRTGSAGITDVRAYGAHEHQLSDHRTGEEGMLIGARWIPPL